MTYFMTIAPSSMVPSGRASQSRGQRPSSGWLTLSGLLAAIALFHCASESASGANARCTSDSDCPLGQGCDMDDPKDGYCSDLCTVETECDPQTKCDGTGATGSPDCDDVGAHRNGKGVCDLWVGDTGPNTCGTGGSAGTGTGGTGTDGTGGSAGTGGSGGSAGSGTGGSAGSGTGGSAGSGTGGSAGSGTGGSSGLADLAEIEWKGLVYEEITRVSNGVMKIPLCIDPTNNPPGEVTVKNTGSGAAGPFNVAFGLVAVDGTYQACSDLYSEGLAPGATAVANAAYCCNIQGTVGAYRVRVVADVNSTVAESDETNNVAESVLHVLKPSTANTCREIVACRVGCSDCGSDCEASCGSDCDAAGSSAALAAWNALLECAATCPASDTTCLDEKCSKELETCATTTEPNALEATRRVVRARLAGGD